MGDKTLNNHLALLGCILSVESPSVDKIIKELTGQDVSLKYKEKWQRKGIRLTDTLTGEVIPFKSQSEVNRYLGIKEGTVCHYMNKGKIYKGRYLFERVDK